MLLSAKLAALRGYKTTCFLPPEEMDAAKTLLFTEAHPEGSLSLEFLPIAGPDVDAEAIDERIASAQGLVIAFDGFQSIPETALNVFMPEGKPTKLERVAVMTRYLNGNGMGFFAAAAKKAANGEVWDGNSQIVQQYRNMEKIITARASRVGAEYTIVRAGTLKGGAVGDAFATAEDGKDAPGGDSRFLNTFFYQQGQQDVVNWRLLYDCGALGVELARGDTMEGPGFTAALTATSPEGGKGDSHRAAAAAALIESLSAASAADSDFSVASKAGRQHPTSAEWQTMFAKA